MITKQEKKIYKKSYSFENFISKSKQNLDQLKSFLINLIEKKLVENKFENSTESILKQIMATKSVKEIVFLGIDFYGTGYLDQYRKKDDKEKYFYPISVGGGINREKKGIPFLKYLADLSENNFFKERFKLFLPTEIKAYIPKEILKKLLKQKSIQFV